MFSLPPTITIGSWKLGHFTLQMVTMYVVCKEQHPFSSSLLYEMNSIIIIIVIIKVVTMMSSNNNNIALWWLADNIYDITQVVVGRKSSNNDYYILRHFCEWAVSSPADWTRERGIFQSWALTVMTLWLFPFLLKSEFHFSNDDSHVLIG